MATKTEHYGFIKPSDSDYYNVEDFNENVDKMEEVLFLKADKAENAVEGNLAALDEDGNLSDSGLSALDFALHADMQERLQMKADKAPDPKEGNMAMLNNEGSVLNSGVHITEIAMRADLNRIEQKVEGEMTGIRDSISGDIYAKAILELTNTPTVEWAIREMSTHLIFGRTLRLAFNLDAHVFDALRTLYDVAGNTTAVSILTSIPAANDLIQASPTFREALNSGTAYIENMTGTEEGINYLLNNYDTMSYICYSPSWQNAFKRNSALTYRLLTHAQWLQAFTQVPDGEAYALFLELAWYNYVAGNIDAWRIVTNAATSGNVQPFDLFVDQAGKFNEVLHNADKLDMVLQNKTACEQAFKNNDEYASLTIYSPHCMTIAQNYNAMSIICNYNNYIIGMVNNRNWCLSVMSENPGASVFISIPNCIEQFTCSGIGTQELSKLTAATTLTQIINANDDYVNNIKRVVMDPNYFIITERKYAVAEYNGAVPSLTFRPEAKGFIVGIRIEYLRELYDVTKLTIPAEPHQYSLSCKIERFVPSYTKDGQYYPNGISYDASQMFGSNYFSLYLGSINLYNTSTYSKLYYDFVFYECIAKE